MLTYNKAEYGDVEVITKDGKPLFIANDVLRILDYKNAYRTLAELDPDEKVSLSIKRDGQRRTVNAITESGLYHLIFRSKAPLAMQFRRWVTEEVLPSLRKNGEYTIANLPASEGLKGMPANLNSIEMYSWYYDNKYLPAIEHKSKGVIK